MSIKPRTNVVLMQHSTVWWLNRQHLVATPPLF